MKKTISLSVILILLDQIIKIIVANFFRDTYVTLISKLLSILPYKNTNLLIGDLLNVQIPIYISVLIQALFLIVVAFGYKYLSYLSSKNKGIMRGFLIFAIAGVCCAFIDAVIWGGSWDYICLYESYIIDLKDAYVAICIIHLLIYLIFYIPQYVSLSKQERKLYGFMLWIRKGCPRSYAVN